MAVALAEAGFRVGVNYFRSGERAEELCAGLRRRGLVAEAFQGMYGMRRRFGVWLGRWGRGLGLSMCWW